MKAHPNSEHVFLNQDGNPFKGKALNDRFERLCLKLKITKIRPYALRHTFASMQSDGGIETNSLASLMGHSSVRTLRRYAKNTYEHHQKAVENLERMLAPLMAPKAEQSDESETKLGKKLMQDLIPSKKTGEK